MAGRFRGRDGFTLIEALVAFVILALITIAVQQAVSTAIAGISRAGDRVDQEAVARTLLTSPLTAGDISAGRSTGTLNGLTWSRTLSPLGQATAGSTGSGWVAMRMTVAVGSATRPGTVSVETVRLVRATP